MRRLLLLAAAWLALGCPKPKAPVPTAPDRCSFDYEHSQLFSRVGNTARARRIEAEAERVGGPHSHGEVGDYLLENDRIRVVIQRPGRNIGPVPYGGAIIDADRKRADNEPGKDALGKIGLLYAFGRTLQASTVEVLADGTGGGPAVIAATGTDAVDDYFNIQNELGRYLGSGVKLAINPEAALPLKMTTYFVLSPGESRVRMLTAFCNEGHENIVMPVGEMVDQGGRSDFFNPDGCANGLGAEGCDIDASSWFGYQADGVAYALRSYKASDPQTPEPKNAVLFVHGVTATVSGGEGREPLLSWLDADAARRPGSFAIFAGKSRNYLRDLLVVRDLGEASSTWAQLDGLGRARLNASVLAPGGAPVPGARVAVVSVATDRQVTLLVADENGRARVDLPPGSYRLCAAVEGAGLEPPKEVQVPSSGAVDATLQVGASRKLQLTVRDPSGAPMPAKATLLCPSGVCATQSLSFRPYFDVERMPSSIAATAFVPPQGSVELSVPPGQYELLVTRGPEYSAWPDTWPVRGEPVDLTTADQQRTAVLARVVDTTGWASADLHVHGVNSADSSIGHEERVLSYLAEGVDVLCSTDHDVVTDFSPTLQALGAQGWMASMTGIEVTPFDFGHQQAYPVVRGAGPTGGAFDWAGGDGPTLRLDQLYAGLREAYPGVVLQLNHPRDRGGSLTELKVDTATGASHALPETFRMEPAPGATSSNTRLFSEAFDAMEVQNGLNASVAVLNDWMTFLSRGAIKTATAVSDSHHARLVTGGYSRTFVEMEGAEDLAHFSPARFAQALKAHRAIGTSGPFVRVSAQRVDAAGQPLGAAAHVGETLQGLNVAAGEKVLLTVDVQAPEWMTFDTIEVFTHAEGREAVNGESNTSWPESRVHQSSKLDLTALPREPVVQSGQTFRRVHVVERFTVSPTRDSWYVVIVRGSSASASLFPLAWRDVTCSGALCTPNSARPYAYTNAILVDADGSGAYDDFPLKVSQGLRMPLPKPPPEPRRVPTSSELAQAIRAMLSHRHAESGGPP